MKLFNVTLPITGHVFIKVEAENEESAIFKAMNECTIDNIENWNALERVNRGNVCYCDQPWEVKVVEEETEEMGN